MSLFGLRRSSTLFDAPAAPRQLDRPAAPSILPAPARETHDSSLIELHPHVDAARQAALDLARRWGQGKRREGGLLFIGEHAGQLPANNLEALHAAVDSGTAAVVIDAGCEALQPEFCRAAAQFCQALLILLVIDNSRETGNRRGALLAERHWGVRADLLIVGEVRGGGLPQAAMLVRTHSQGLSTAASARCRPSPIA
jgi:glutamate-1-semialdehyde aminotransferase